MLLLPCLNDVPTQGGSVTMQMENISFLIVLTAAVKLTRHLLLRALTMLYRFRSSRYLIVGGKVVTSSSS